MTTPTSFGSSPSSFSAPGMVCSGVCCGFSKGSTLHDVVVVVAGIDQEAALRVLDQDRIDGKADLAAGAAVPVDVIAVEDERAAVEQVDLGVSHDRTP